MLTNELLNSSGDQWLKSGAQGGHRKEHHHVWRLISDEGNVRFNVRRSTTRDGLGKSKYPK